MTQSASGNGAGTKRSSSATFCTWEIPDKGVKIDLHLSTVEWVDFEMKKALRFPAQGGEVSGLLLGRTEPGASGTSSLKGSHPCPESKNLHRVPVLRVGQAHFESADRSVAAGSGKEPLCGWVLPERSQWRFRPDEQDAAVGKEYFSGSTSVFLLVKPSLTETSTGAFFLCENGEIKPDSKIIFPFNRTSLAGRPAIFASGRKKPLPGGGIFSGPFLAGPL